MSGRRRTAAWVRASTNGHQDEGPEIEIGDIYLISMCLEIAPDQCITLSDVSLDVFEPPNTWDLFRKDATQLGINSMSLDRNPNEFARSELNRRAAQGAPCHLGNLLGMAVNNRCHQRLLAREVRVQRTDADPATSPILLVLALSYLRIRQKRDSGISSRLAISERARKMLPLRSRFSELSPVTT
jgi:hypothetical protein